MCHIYQLCFEYAFIYHLFVRKRPTGSEKSWDAKLRAFISNQIVTDPSEVYGEGFRTAAQCSEALGLEVLLDHIRESKDFPRIS